MENRIKENLHNPEVLESLYRASPAVFTAAFHQIYPDVQSDIAAQIWFERLRGVQSEITWGNLSDWAFVAIAAIISAFLMQMPDLFSISHDFYFPRNIAFIVLPGMAGFFVFKQGLPFQRLLWPMVLMLFSIVFVNLLPDNLSSNTLILTCIHVPLLMWFLVGYIFSGAQWSEVNKRVNFLRFHGDLLVMSAVILLAGGLFTALTINLFNLIDIKIEDIYFRYLVLSVLPSVPLLATLLVHQNPTLVSKISPVIARIFTPVVTVMLVLFLCAFMFSGKDPYNDREFLLIFNGVLVGVMALVLFSVSEATKESSSFFQRASLVSLAVLAIVNNGIALSAIAFRLVELGITPNRLAVFGSNILVLIHLILVTRELIGLIRGQKKVGDVEASMTYFLPVYAFWAAIVSVVFPFVFSFQ